MLGIKCTSTHKRRHGGAKGAASPQPALNSILRFAQIRWEVWTHSMGRWRWGGVLMWL